MDMIENDKNSRDLAFTHSKEFIAGKSKEYKEN